MKADDAHDRALPVAAVQKEPGREFRASKLKTLTGGVPKARTRQLLQGVEGVRIDDLWLAVFPDDVDSPDLAVHTSPGVVEKFRPIVTAQ